MAAPYARPSQPGHLPPAPPQNIDSPAIYKAAYDLAFGQLEGLPAGSRAENAKQIAEAVVEIYVTQRNQGVNPGPAQQQAMGWANTWIENVQKANGLKPAAPGADNLLPGQNPGSVNGEDVAAGTDVFRDAIKDGKPLLERIRDKTGVPDPSAVDFFNKNRVNPVNVHASTIDPLSKRLEGVQQGTTTVEGADVSDLQATARGEGAGQQAARARMDQLLFRQGQQASGQIQQAHGYEKRGLRRALIGQQAEQTIAAGKNLAEIDATTSLAAQKDVASFDEKRKSLQATLDAARLSGDADRIQRAEKDMADFEQETKKFNAGQTQTAATTNAANTQNAQGTNLTAGIQAIGQDFESWKATNELALSAQKALEASAQGLLSEDQRQQMLAMARRQLENAEKEFEEMKRRNARAEDLQAQQQKISFWGTLLTTLVARVVPTPKPAASGGVVDRATQLLVGEAGDHEIVIPLKGRVSDRLLQALSVDSKPFEAAGPRGQIDSLEELTQAIRSTLKTAPKVDDDMTSMLASATLRSRRGR